MNNVKFNDLLRWDLHQALRSRLLWFVVAIMAAAFIWGALNSARMHSAQTQALTNALSYEQQWLTDLRSRAEQYRVQAPTPLPYWQDPTDVAGFSQYFLFKHSLKPHLPSSPLAIGVSDLLPPRLPVKLSTPFGVEASYDFQNPRSLALGQFDLAFAVVYLLPVALILLFGLMATYERDRGVLRLIAAQAVSPRLWLMARVAAITVVVLPSLFTCGGGRSLPRWRSSTTGCAGNSRSAGRHRRVRAVLDCCHGRRVVPMAAGQRCDQRAGDDLGRAGHRTAVVDQ